MSTKGSLPILTFHAIRTSYSSYSSPMNFLEIRRKFPCSCSQEDVATCSLSKSKAIPAEIFAHAQTFDRVVPLHQDASTSDDFVDQVPVVQKLKNDIHCINHYPVNNAIGFPNTFPPHSALHSL